MWLNKWWISWVLPSVLSQIHEIDSKLSGAQVAQENAEFVFHKLWLNVEDLRNQKHISRTSLVYHHFFLWLEQKLGLTLVKLRKRCHGTGVLCNLAITNPWEDSGRIFDNFDTRKATWLHSQWNDSRIFAVLTFWATKCHFILGCHTSQQKQHFTCDLWSLVVLAMCSSCHQKCSNQLQDSSRLVHLPDLCGSRRLCPGAQANPKKSSPENERMPNVPLKINGLKRYSLAVLKAS